jgi:hypothetical protein
LVGVAEIELAQRLADRQKAPARPASGSCAAARLNSALTYHRRFYTSNMLLADIEEAIDPAECRVRLLGEVDRDCDSITGRSASGNFTRADVPSTRIDAR